MLPQHQGIGLASRGELTYNPVSSSLHPILSLSTPLSVRSCLPLIDEAHTACGHTQVPWEAQEMGLRTIPVMVGRADETQGPSDVPREQRPQIWSLGLWMPLYEA